MKSHKKVKGKLALPPKPIDPDAEISGEYVAKMLNWLIKDLERKQKRLD